MKREKEIGKLLELLNEYEKELNTGLHWRIDEKYGMLWRGLNLMGVDQYLISKHYGFIKWLVENDKIDRGKFEVEYTDKQTLKDVYIAGAKQDELLIMLLSISSSPIDDLISYLK